MAKITKAQAQAEAAAAEALAIEEQQQADAALTAAAEALMASQNVNIAERDRFEREENGTGTIGAKLISYFKLDHKTLETKRSVEFYKPLVATGFLQNFDFINDSVQKRRRFNIYGVQKAAAKIEAVAAGKLTNEASLPNKFCVAAVLACLANRDKAEFTFSSDSAKAMLSRAFNFEHVKRSDFVNSFNVTAGTAGTQVSSSFRVLEALKIVSFDDSQRARKIVSGVNFDNAFVKLVAERFEIAL